MSDTDTETNENKTERFTVRLPVSLLEKVKAKAERRGEAEARNVKPSEIVREAIEMAV